jgi:ABC-2 type transport system permease protein
VLTGNLHAFSALTPAFWSSAGLYLLTVLISMGVTILLAVAATALGRSLAFGLGVGLLFFPADNIGVLILAKVNELTGNAFWLNITQYFLGPNLNMMPSALVPSITAVVPTQRGIVTAAIHAQFIGFAPLVSVDGAHTLLVTLAFALVFTAIAIILTWRRDVHE